MKLEHPILHRSKLPSFSRLMIEDLMRERSNSCWEMCVGTSVINQHMQKKKERERETGALSILFFPNLYLSSVQFSHSVVSDSVTPKTAVCQDSLSITSSRSLLKFMSIKSVMPSNHLYLLYIIFAKFNQFISTLHYLCIWNLFLITLTS